MLAFNRVFFGRALCEGSFFEVRGGIMASVILSGSQLHIVGFGSPKKLSNG